MSASGVASMLTMHVVAEKLDRDANAWLSAQDEDGDACGVFSEGLDNGASQPMDVIITSINHNDRV